MSLLLTGALIGGGILLGRFIARTVLGAKNPESMEEEEEGDAAASSAPAPRADAPARDPYRGLPCKLGDVILRAGGEEAWLAGALVFSEDAVVAVLFVAPEAKHDRAILARASAAGRLLWLEPIAPGEIAMGAEPPSSLEHAGTRFDRARRLPMRVERAGTGAPDVGDRAIVAEYTTKAGDALVVVLGAGGPRAWRGVALDDGTYDVLPGGREHEL